MSEPKNQYSLEFVLGYDKDVSVTFTASIDDPWIAWMASREILHLNSSMVSNRTYNQTEVAVTLYKNGQPLDSSALPEEMRKYKESRKK